MINKNRIFSHWETYSIESNGILVFGHGETNLLVDQTNSCLKKFGAGNWISSYLDQTFLNKDLTSNEWLPQCIPVSAGERWETLILSQRALPTGTACESCINTWEMHQLGESVWFIRRLRSIDIWLIQRPNIGDLFLGRRMEETPRV